MKHKWSGAVALLLFILASPLAAQSARELRGEVFHLGENGEKVVEPGLIVTFEATGASDDTNDQGIFRLPLPLAFQPGDSVTLSIDKPGWRIRYPLDGEAKVPRNLLSETVPVELLPVRSKLFWTHDRIEKFIQDASERSKQAGRREEAAPSLDLGREIKDWATQYGFSAEEARAEIDRWIAEVEAAHEDNYKKGLAAFYKQQFDAAADRFRDSAAWRIRQLEETRKQEERLAEREERLREEVARDLRLEGDSHYYAHRYQQAVTVYEQALQYISKEQTPQLWAATLNDIGVAHKELGSLGEAAESPAHLAAAVEAYRQALTVYNREQLPQGWAMTQTNLGAALQEQGQRTSGAEGAQLLAQAVEAYRKALLIFTPAQFSQWWALARSNQSGALLALQRYEEAAEALAEVLAKEPDDRRTFSLLLTTLSDRLFHHEEAAALTRSWLGRHPADLVARLELGEQLFASRAFSESSQEFSLLLKEQGLSASHRVVLLGYAIAAGLAKGAPDVPVSELVEELIGLVSAQPSDFSASWTFEGTLHSLGAAPEVPHKDLLLRLFQALEAPDRDRLLAGLREVKEAILRAKR